MPDREKVIRGLEACIKGDCRENACPYALENECRKRLGRDAQELLEAQEPVEPAIGGNQKSFWYYICPICQLAIDKGDKYCRHCGRAEKWDD